MKRLFGGYVVAKQAQNVLDYDDLLLAWAQVMQNTDFAKYIGANWDHVLIDEYQGANRLQARILLALKPDGRGLTVAGDDAQSIYASRAATVRNILDFPDAFTPPADVITLDQNYRSTKPILEAANAVIGLARERFTKDLWTERLSEQKPRLVTLSNEAGHARSSTFSRTNSSMSFLAILQFELGTNTGTLNHLKERNAITTYNGYVQPISG